MIGRLLSPVLKCSGQLQMFGMKLWMECFKKSWIISRKNTRAHQIRQILAVSSTKVVCYIFSINETHVYQTIKSWEEDYLELLKWVFLLWRSFYIRDLVCLINIMISFFIYRYIRLDVFYVICLGMNRLLLDEISFIYNVLKQN